MCVRVFGADVAFPAVGVGPSRGVRAGCSTIAGLREGERVVSQGNINKGNPFWWFVENGLIN